MAVKTLLVDNEKALLEQAEIFLNKMSGQIRIHTTTSAEKALDLMDEESFDVVVSDYQMPEMNGLELLDLVRNERNSDIPFIIFTGKGREEVAMEALNLGADRYLHKGGDPKAQYGVLKQAIIQEVEHFDAKIELRESEEKYRNLFNEAPIGIIYYDENGTIKECNEKFEEFMSAPQEELIGLNMVDELKNEEVIEAAKSSLEDGEGYFEGWYTSITGGEKRYGSAIFKGLENKNGKIESGICIVEDITDRKEAKKKLKESEKKYRRIIEQMDDVYYRTDMEGKLIEVSPHGEELLGFEEDEMIGKRVTRFYSNEKDREKFLEKLEKKGRVKNFEAELESKDGKVYQVLINSHYIEAENGELEGVEGIISDITEMKKTKKKLEKRNEKIKRLHEKAKEFEELESEEDICELVVDASEKILDFYACGISFKEDGEFRVKADRRGFYKKVDTHPIEGIAGKTFREKESFLIRDMDKKKEAVPKKESYRSAISIPFGDIGVFQALSEDKDYFNEKDLELAEILIEHAVESLNRHRSEKKVRKNKKRYENLFEENPEAMVEVDEDFKIIDANTRFKDLFGYENEKIEGRNIKALISLQTKIEDAEDLNKGTDEGSYFENETIGFNKEGKEIPVSIKWKKIQEKNKTKFVGVCRDISERKKAEEEKDLLLEKMEGQVWYLKDPETYGRVNQSHADFLGKDRSEIENENIHEIASSKKEADKLIEGNKKVCEKKKTIKTEEWVKNGDGEERLLSITRTPKTVDGEIEYVVCSARDVTEKTVADKKIKYSQLVENLNEIVYILNENAEIEYISPNVEEKSGYSVSELKEKGFVEFVHPEDLEGRLENFGKVLNGESEPSEYRYITKDGEVVWVRTHARPVKKNGEIVGVQGVLTDITERKKIEEREEFLHSLLRHDVDNKNQIVRGYLELLKDSDLSDENKSLVEKANKAVNESSRIIEKTRKLRKIDEEEAISETNLNSVFDEVLSNLEDRLKNIDYKVNVSDKMVKGGPLLEGLFSNLVNNSIQHSGCQKIKITTESKGDEILCTVEDDGIGIKDEYKDKIFDRGFKTGDNGGSGLGMYIVKEIAESYGGSIEVKDSELGGARFDVKLKEV